MAGMARVMGATLMGAQKLSWQKIKIFIYSILNDYILRPAQPLKLHSCINTAALYNAGRIVSAPWSILPKLWYFDTTRRSVIVTEQESSLAVLTRHCHYHVITKAKSEPLRFRQKDIQKSGLRRVQVLGCENLTQITAFKLPQIYKLPKLLWLTHTLRNSFDGHICPI